jgi:hypothetical protein
VGKGNMLPPKLKSFKVIVSKVSDVNEILDKKFKRMTRRMIKRGGRA